MKNFKYWTLVLAIAAGATAPLYGCSSDDVDTSGKKKNTDAGSDAADDDGEDGDGGEGGSGGEGGNGDGGNGGDGGSGGGPEPKCNIQFENDKKGDCSACASIHCCDEIAKCQPGSACDALNTCINDNCASETTQQGFTACVQSKCADEAAEPGAIADRDAMGACLCGAATCGSECTGVTCQ